MDLEVHWAGQSPARIGHLHQDAGGTVFFEYDRLWRSGAMELSPIYLPNSTRGSVSTPTPWLVKFDTDPGFPIGRIEAAYADMARAAGIAMPPTRLLEAAGGAHFMVRRFDRDGQGHRLHLHSYSGLTHTPLRDGLDYGDLMDLARNLTKSQASVVGD